MRLAHQGQMVKGQGYRRAGAYSIGRIWRPHCLLKTALMSLQATLFVVGSTTLFQSLGVALPISRMSWKRPCPGVATTYLDLPWGQEVKGQHHRSNLWTQHIENGWIDFAANRQKWSVGQGDETVTRSKVKVTWSQNYIWRPSGGLVLNFVSFSKLIKLLETSATRALTKWNQMEEVNHTDNGDSGQLSLSSFLG